jgi:hypothetical protein
VNTRLIESINIHECKCGRQAAISGDTAHKCVRACVKPIINSITDEWMYEYMECFRRPAHTLMFVMFVHTNGPPRLGHA